MRANDATGRTPAKRSGKRCIVVLGVLGGRDGKKVKGEGKERGEG